MSARCARRRTAPAWCRCCHGVRTAIRVRWGRPTSWTCAGAIAPPQLVFASTTAFLLSELADFAVYTPLQARGLVLAVLASSVVGLIADSILFLWLAFGSLEFLAGQIVGKLWMVVVSLPFIHWIRQREIARQIAMT